MTAAGSLPHWSAAEEIAHSVSHGVGIVLAIAGLVALVAMGAAHGDAWDVTSAAIYGTTLVLLYVASTLYHAIPLWRAKRVATGRAPILSTALYVIMGWCVVVAFGPLVRSVAVGGVTLLLVGGLCYTVGLVFYAWKGLRFHHFVWHLFVLAGSVLHWLAVLLYVIPPP